MTAFAHEFENFSVVVVGDELNAYFYDSRGLETTPRYRHRARDLAIQLMNVYDELAFRGMKRDPELWYRISLIQADLTKVVVGL